MMSTNLSTTKASNILRHVQFESGFHFMENCVYNGMTSTSLNEFERHLQLAGTKSIEHHFRREDFQKWIKNVLYDSQLSAQLDMIDKNLSGEALRSEILKIIRNRIMELNDELFGKS